MELYHGTLARYARDIMANGVDLSRCRPYRDFGPGFYTTTVLRQAEAWAWQLTAAHGASAQPAVVAFQVDRDQLASLDCLWFIRGSHDAEDYWSLIFHCRSGATDHARGTTNARYDVTAGPVAAIWRQRVVLYDYDQVGFHTDRAMGVLNGSSKWKAL